MELVTVISIISILVATGVPSFVNYQRHNSIRIASQDIKSFLTEARALSLNPRPEDKGKQYYYVKISPASISLKVNDVDEPIKGPIEFGKDVVVDTGSTTYNFNIPSGEGTFGDGKIVLNLKDPRGGEEVFKQTINVDAVTGNVEIIEGVNGE